MRERKSQEAIEAEREAPTRVNRRTRRRKFTSSLICHHSHGAISSEKNGVTPYQDAYDSTYSSELLPFGELVLFRIPLPHTRRANQNRTIYRGDSGWDKGFWCGRLDEDNAHIIVTEDGREIARTARRLKGLPWDGQGLLRRGGPSKLVSPEP